MWELVLCWFGACNEFLGIGYFCVGVSVSQTGILPFFHVQDQTPHKQKPQNALSLIALKQQESVL